MYGATAIGWRNRAVRKRPGSRRTLLAALSQRATMPGAGRKQYSTTGGFSGVRTNCITQTVCRPQGSMRCDVDGNSVWSSYLYSNRLQPSD